METNYQGQQNPGDSAGQYGAQAFVIKQMISRIQTMTLVKVLACTNSGGVSPVGFVDVQPLVNQIDGEGNGKSHKPIYNLPYSRLQGGSNAFILDPKVGDIGIAGFASRSIAGIKKTRKISNPDTFSQFSMSDGLYLGGVLNGIPVNYIQFTGSGDIIIHSEGTVTLSAETISLSAGTINSSGAWEHSGTLKNNGSNVGSTHRHSDPQGGVVGSPF